MTEQEAYVALNLVPGLGPVTVRRLVERLGTAAALLEMDKADCRSVGLSYERADAFRDALRSVDVAAECERAHAVGAVILTPADAAYPKALRNLHDPPTALYVQGDPAVLDRSGVALVGTRHPTVYGRETARRFGYRLAAVGCVVFSGLARGIDAEAHGGALEASGCTVGVLGSALDCLTPVEHRKLAEEMTARGGAVISEFPMGRRADRTTFPMRNRIVSGLSAGVLVIEAPRRSGALITAAQALEQGRCVMAVPGRVDVNNAHGCHRLIRDGAVLVETVDDVLEEIDSLAPLRSTAADTAESASDAPRRATPLGAEEHRLLEALGTEEMDVDELIRGSGIAPARVGALLFGLEIKRLVKMLPGRRLRAC